MTATIDTFDANAFAENLASALNISLSQISIVLTAASVNILATITTDDQGVIESIRALTQNRTAFETRTAVTVERLGPISIEYLVVEAPPPPPFNPLEVNDGILQGGILASDGQFPFMVLSLACRGSSCSMCSATLVGTPDKPYVLTAKHCVDGWGVEDIEFYACGTLNVHRRSVNTRMTAYGAPDRVYLHPRSTPASMSEMYHSILRDVALVPIKPESVPECAAFREIAPAGSASLEIKVDLIGYGFDDETETTGMYRVGDLQYLNDMDLKRIYYDARAAWRTSEDRVYAYGQDFRMDSAVNGTRQGDSGGPMLDQNGRILAVASYGTGDFEQTGHAGLVTEEMSQWITRTLARDESQHTRHSEWDSADSFQDHHARAPTPSTNTRRFSSSSSAPSRRAQTIVAQAAVACGIILTSLSHFMSSRYTLGMLR